jgi:hypothetical protein
VSGTAGRVIQADGRSKAYRPLPRPERAAAVRAGLEAYDRGDFFLAHELLEPAWMGTDDVRERALIQGLIKLAAADVHGVRGNPAGVARNLGARWSGSARRPNRPLQTAPARAACRTSRRTHLTSAWTSTWRPSSLLPKRASPWPAAAA